MRSSTPPSSEVEVEAGREAPEEKGVSGRQSYTSLRRRRRRLEQALMGVECRPVNGEWPIGGAADGFYRVGRIGHLLGFQDSGLNGRSSWARQFPVRLLLPRCTAGFSFFFIQREIVCGYAMEMLS